MNRNIETRVREIAPFLTLDEDPYLVVKDGELMWVQPAYTTASAVPYSQPQGEVNYLRHSVTVTVDAQSGDMVFYLTDPSDAVAATWAKIFPDLFVPDDQMPDEVRAHVRYPLDMFKVQARQYLRYHITDPSEFFIAEDVWNIPTERFGTEEQPVEPYYVVMRLPRGDNTDEVLEEVEFVLIMPFTPAGAAGTPWHGSRGARMARTSATSAPISSPRTPTSSAPPRSRRASTRIRPSRSNSRCGTAPAPRSSAGTC